MSDSREVALLRMLLTLCPRWKPAEHATIPPAVRQWLADAPPPLLQRVLLELLHRLSQQTSEGSAGKRGGSHPARRSQPAPRTPRSASPAARRKRRRP